MKQLKKCYVEITSVCNLSCTFCPPTERQKTFISLEDFRQRLEQIRDYTDSIYLHVKGEPLLHPKLDQLLDISHEYGIKVNITTNGTLIAKNRAKLLGKPALRQINFSLHSFDGHPGSQDKAGYLADILSFTRDAMQQTKTIISYRLWNLTTDNGTNQERSRNRELLSMIEEAFGLAYRIEERFERGKGLKIGERVYLNQDHEFQWPSLDAEEDEGKGFCYGLRTQAAILANGTVVPCCLDGEGVIDLGNIGEQRFGDILTSERATAIVVGFSRREAVEELCRKCGYRKRFGMEKSEAAVARSSAERN